MAILDFFRAQRARERREVTTPVISAIELGTRSVDWSISTEFAIDEVSRHPTVAACLDAVASMAASVRPGLRIRGEAQAEHPLLTLLWHPAPRLDYGRLIRTIVHHWLLAGRFALEKVRSGIGDVVSLLPLPPHRIAERYDARGELVALRLRSQIGREVEIPADNVVTLLDPSPVDPFRPYARAEIIRDIVRADASIVRYVGDVARQGLVRLALITREPTTDKQRRELQQRFDAEYGQYAQSKATVPVIDGTRAEIARLGLSPDEIAVEELLSVTEARICSVLGVPPIVISANVGLKRATYANYREARQHMWGDVVVPLLQQLGQAFETQLARDFGLEPEETEIVFDLEDAPGLEDSRESIWSRAVQGWRESLLSRNEARAMLGLPRDSEGDVYRSTMSTLTEPAQVESEA